MTSIPSPAGIRELSATEVSDVAGGAINIDFKVFGIRFMFFGGDDWQSMCVAGDSTYSCVTSVGGQTYTSSGPVPQ